METSKRVVGPLNIRGLLALAGMTGPVVLIAADFAAASSYHGYSFVRNSISSLALAPLGWAQTIGFLAIGLLIEVFVVGLLVSIRGRRAFGLGVGILALFGFGLLVVGAFHTDQAEGPRTVEGLIHAIAAAATFGLFPIASSLIALGLMGQPYWKRFSIFTAALNTIALALLVMRAWPSILNGWFGLYERILVAVEVAWIEAAGMWLVRLSLRRQRGRG